jgi:uncharacterized protein HemX
MHANPANAYLFVWLAWLTLVLGFACLRFTQVQHEKRERQTRRQEREAPGERRERSERRARATADETAAPRIAQPRQKLGAEYRQQLIAAGIIKPAEPEQSA